MAISFFNNIKYEKFEVISVNGGTHHLLWWRPFCSSCSCWKFVKEKPVPFFNTKTVETQYVSTCTVTIGGLLFEFVWLAPAKMSKWAQNNPASNQTKSIDLLAQWFISSRDTHPWETSFKSPTQKWNKCARQGGAGAVIWWRRYSSSALVQMGEETSQYSDKTKHWHPWLPPPHTIIYAGGVWNNGSNESEKKQHHRWCICSGYWKDFWWQTPLHWHQQCFSSLFPLTWWFFHFATLQDFWACHPLFVKMNFQFFPVT